MLRMRVVPRVIKLAVLEELHISGRAVGHELAGTERLAASGFGPQPAYSSADKNLRVAAQIAGEMETLECDELRERTRRMRELLAVASRQQEETELPSDRLDRGLVFIQPPRQIGGWMEHLGSRSRHLRLMGAELAIAETHRLHAAGWTSLRSTAGVKSDQDQQGSQSTSA